MKRIKLILQIVLLGGALFSSIIAKEKWLDKNIISLAKDDIVNNAFFWGMLFVSLFIIINRLIKDSKIIRELEQMSVELKDINSSNFESKYQEINEFMKDEKYQNLSEVWRYFSSTFIKKEKSIFKTQDAEVFFNPDALLKEKMNYKLVNYIPQMLMGLGMLGTFLGLSLGLSELNLTQGNNGQLTHLIDGTKTAFYTSLYGMYFSMLLSIFLNFHFGYYEELILKIKNKLNFEIRDYSRDQSLESIKDTLTEISKAEKVELIRQEVCLLSNNLGEKFIDSMQEYNRTNKAHLEKIDDLIGKNIINLSEEITASFEEKLEKTFSKELVNKFEVLKNQLSGIYSENSENIKTYNNEVVGIAESLSKTRESLIEFTHSTLGEFSQILNQMGVRYKEGIDINEKSEKLYESCNSLIERNQEALKISTPYFEKIDSMSKIFENFVNKEESLVSFWNNNSNIMENLSDQMEKYRVDFSQLMETQENKYRTLYVDNLKKLFVEYDESLSSVISKFKNILEENNIQNKELLELSKNTTSTLELINKNFQYSQEEIGKSKENIDSELKNKINFLFSNFQDIASSLEKILGGINNGTEDAKNQIIKGTDETVAILRESIGGINQTIEGLNKKISEVDTKYISQINHKLETVVKEVRKNNIGKKK